MGEERHEPYNPFIDQAVLRIKEREAKGPRPERVRIPKKYRGFVIRWSRQQIRRAAGGLRVKR